MPRALSSILAFIVAAGALAGAAAAQTSDGDETAFWPQAELYLKLSDYSRFYGIATYTFSNDDASDNEQYGLNVDFFLKGPPMLNHRGAVALAINRTQKIQLRVGYRYSRSIDDPTLTVQNRLLAELTLRATPKSIKLADRNGFDMRWINGVYSTRYRNRIYAEVPVVLARYDFTPYANVEWYYSITDDEWTSVRYEVGAQLPVVDHVSVELYAGLQNYWHSSDPTQRGPGINLVFSW